MGLLAIGACGGHAPPASPVEFDGAHDVSAYSASHFHAPGEASGGDEEEEESAKRGAPLTAVGPGFPESGPWVSFYGTAAKMKDLARVAKTFRIINIDADPGDDGAGNFTDAQLAVLKAGGRNKVLSYLNIGSCERTRTYWTKAAPPYVPCSKNKAAQRGAYHGYPDETWMDPSDPDYQDLIVGFVAPRLAARGVDGFYLDNLEIVDHPVTGHNGPCNARCKQGGLDIVKRLRDAFPDLLLVMQNGTGETTRLGTTGGVPFPTLLDGIAHEEVYEPHHDATAEAELLAWKRMNLRTRGGLPFWIATEDYVGSCKSSAEDRARGAWSRSRHHGFSPYISDESGGQNVVCYWPF